MHDFEITVIEDCVMSDAADEKKNAIEHMTKRLKAKILKSQEMSRAETAVSS